MADKYRTEIFLVTRTGNADSTENPKPIVVGASEQENLGHIVLLYLAGHVHDNNLYSSIDAEAYGEIASYLDLFWDV